MRNEFGHIPSAMDLRRAMERGALTGLGGALPHVVQRASFVAPYATFRGGLSEHHLRDGAIIIEPKSDPLGNITGKVAFQVHSNAKSSRGFSYARARHEGYYYVTSDGQRNYEGRGRRVPTTGHFEFRHSVDPHAEHQFLYHAARTSRFDVQRIIGTAIAMSLRSSV